MADEMDVRLLFALKVAVGKETDEVHGQVWYAQGLDVDFAASGESLEDVQRRFSRGLHSTIEAHLYKYGDASRLQRTPRSVWKRFFDDDMYDVHLIGVESFPDAQAEDFPFTELAYIEPGTEQVA